MPRAYWKGFLRLSLVTCPIELFPASSQAEKTHFHQINKKTGNRLRQQMVDEETGRVVEGDDKGRGYELSKGRYVEIEEDELEAVEIESTHTIDIDSFVPRVGDRQALSRQALLHRPGRQDRRRGVRGHPRRDEGQGPRGAGPHRHGTPRAHHRARAARQGTARHDASLRLRGPGREGLFQGNPAAAHRQGHGEARRAHPRQQGRAFRPGQVQGPVRDRAEEAGPPQGRRARRSRSPSRRSRRAT